MASAYPFGVQWYVESKIRKWIAGFQLSNWHNGTHNNLTLGNSYWDPNYKSSLAWWPDWAEVKFPHTMENCMASHTQVPTHSHTQVVTTFHALLVILILVPTFDECLSKQYGHLMLTQPYWNSKADVAQASTCYGLVYVLIKVLATLSTKWHRP